VKESVSILAPIFGLFLVTHAILIAGGIGTHVTEVPRVAAEVSSGFRSGLAELGAAGLFAVFVRAYSMGAGTYTGIEAVSNGIQIMREPKVHTARRTMGYMAISLALTAGGILLCYLLFHVVPEEGKTLNAVLADRFAGGWRSVGRARPRLRRRRPAGGGGAPPRGRPDGLHRRAARHGQHGDRLVAAASLRSALGPAHDAGRRAAHGHRVPRDALLHAG
jgi:hypothetical protein